jgi:hypothetical protein
MENEILVGTLTERYSDHLIVSGVKIDMTERVSADRFPGASITVAAAACRAPVRRSSQ